MKNQVEIALMHERSLLAAAICRTVSPGSLSITVDISFWPGDCAMRERRFFMCCESPSRGACKAQAHVSSNVFYILSVSVEYRLSFRRVTQPLMASREVGTSVVPG